METLLKNKQGIPPVKDLNPDLLLSGQVPYQLGQLALADKRQFEPALTV